MTPRSEARVAGLAVVLATIALPLLGAWADGRDLRPIFTFPPPLAIPAGYPRFSWIAVALVIAPFAALGAAWITDRRRRAIVGPPRPEPAHSGSARAVFPAWGWAALGWTLGWWVLAWNRFDWFAPFQRYTFLPLWLGFIVTVNAVTRRATGTCLLVRAPRRWLALFVTSAVFWWVFEWLNRFSHNWHYLGVGDFGAAAYALNATLCFSTVLPAVNAVAELLANVGGMTVRAAGPPFRWLRRRAAGFVLIAAGVAGLLGTGFAPLQWYAALWAAPLAMLVGDSIVARRDDVVAEVAEGNWGRCVTWAVAALVCGFFWEMWNVHSAARWIYTVPYVDRWHLFEMPLLGYAGYLPFGLECYFVTTRVLGTEPFSSASST